MTEKLKQKIKEEMVFLPKEFQNAINAIDWGTISEEIGKKYLLDADEIHSLQVLVGLVLVGLTAVELCAQSIEDNIPISKEESIKIANEAIEKIFQPVANIFKENVKKNIDEKKITWEQNINFIISGGDYTVFLEKEKLSEKMLDTPVQEKTPMNYSKIEDLKNKFTI
jgi:hypothetical protein